MLMRAGLGLELVAAMKSFLSVFLLHYTISGSPIQATYRNLTRIGQDFKK
jgi:hypothetical protein